ncbi:Ada metal-binding domain-containing protein [Paenibacillus ginsengarvi]|uniref:DNA-3-methyladenine glycosylase II n=1 Tax=Paenibacillus ginsengarvi TaxID=400777 RepID=A0A3B0BX07_9BACL|nr:Ada metal-binding domain-containing protein [Paenibacillus ginsengarvi]RKN77091.1 DNA-3-methyladenine glycosylase [Paenibacillus ginsengarvi]
MKQSQSTENAEWDAPYVIGVTTMSIYCFPWCKGRPKPENTVRFETRAEAEQAGYRPCKSCCSTLPPGAWEDHKHELKLFVSGPFSFEQNVSYMSRSTNECLFQIKDGNIYKALSIEDETPVVEIRADDEQTITVRFLGDTTPARKWVRAAVARYVRDWLDLDTDLLPFYEMAQTDALLRQAIVSFRGLRTIGIPDLFEALSWGIIGQQINLAFAYTLKRRLVETYGRRIECEGETYWIFPTPQQITGLTVQDMEPLRMTVKKCEYLIHVAGLIAEGKLTKTQLLGAGSAKAAEKTLTQIRGIGPWTAHYVLMRCLRFPSAFPIDDVGLHNAIKHVLSMDRKPMKAEILELSAGWTNWESYATFYLWRFLY